VQPVALQRKLLPCTAARRFVYWIFRSTIETLSIQIIAQALAENIPVITRDEQFRLYNDLTVIW
jgi:PIN domain nuclease of toxin-antitoxin system